MARSDAFQTGSGWPAKREDRAGETAAGGAFVSEDLAWGAGEVFRGCADVASGEADEERVVDRKDE